jgi:hypothetical protein
MHMSVAAPEWRAHLLQQIGWIMEYLDPDAIVIDETFGGLGYDYHPARSSVLGPGLLSAHAITLFKQIAELVHECGPDKVVLTSDCGFASFVLWADGEAGDHAYPELLGEAQYRQAPAPYRAALGEKPWIPCAWQTQRFWQEQLELAESAGAGIGLSNGWLEYCGLAGLPPEVADRILDAL